MKTLKKLISQGILKVLIFIFAISVVQVLITSCGKNNKTNLTEVAPTTTPVPATMPDDGGTEPFINVDEMPLFPGGDAAMINYIKENVIYPPIAKEKGIQGKVLVRFSVTEKGEVNRVSILEGVSEEINNEAIRVIKTLPEFTPGKKDGKPVSVWYTVPISFTLK